MSQRFMLQDKSFDLLRSMSGFVIDEVHVAPYTDRVRGMAANVVNKKVNTRERQRAAFDFSEGTGQEGGGGAWTPRRVRVLSLLSITS